jgi:hypothetical protein
LRGQLISTGKNGEIFTKAATPLDSALQQAARRALVAYATNHVSRAGR